jgi:hypothetical protein
VDLRKAQPEIVKNLRDIMHKVRADYDHARSAQVADVADSFGSVSNPKTRDTVQRKLEKYSGGEKKESAPEGKVKVSDGKETYFVSPKDAVDALKDGFKVVE